MKKIIFIIFLFALAFAKGQDTVSTAKEYKNQMRFSLTQFFNNCLFFSYEKHLKNNNGFLIGAGPVYSEISNDTKSGFNTELQYKLYITTKTGRHTVSRIYVSPYLSYKYLVKQSENIYWINNTYTTTITKNYFNSFCPGIIAGYNIVSYHRLVLDFFIGGGMKRTFDSDFVGKVDYDNGSIFEPGYNGVVPRCGFELGVTF
jgi:hypothetical protein